MSSSVKFWCRVVISYSLQKIFGSFSAVRCTRHNGLPTPANGVRSPRIQINLRIYSSDGWKGLSQLVPPPPPTGRYRYEQSSQTEGDLVEWCGRRRSSRRVDCRRWSGTRWSAGSECTWCWQARRRPTRDPNRYLRCLPAPRISPPTVCQSTHTIYVTHTSARNLRLWPQGPILGTVGVLIPWKYVGGVRVCFDRRKKCHILSFITVVA